MTDRGGRRADLSSIVDGINEMPSLPPIYTEVERVSQDPRTSGQQLAEIISMDTVLAARLLRLVNSAYYGFPSRISTISRAVSLLGFGTVRGLVLSTSVYDALSEGVGRAGLDLDGFWRHSVGAAVAARTIAKVAGHADVEELFVGGLLHDIGLLIEDRHMSDEYAAVIDRIRREGKSAEDLEMEMLGITHSEIGAMLLRMWKLPRQMVMMVRYHHEAVLAGRYRRQAAILSVGNALAHAEGWAEPDPGRVPAIDADIWELTRLEESDIEPVMDEIVESFDDTMRFFLER